MYRFPIFVGSISFSNPGGSWPFWAVSGPGRGALWKWPQRTFLIVPGLVFNSWRLQAVLGSFESAGRPPEHDPGAYFLRCWGPFSIPSASWFFWVPAGPPKMVPGFVFYFARTRNRLHAPARAVWGSEFYFPPWSSTKRFPQFPSLNSSCPSTHKYEAHQERLWCTITNINNKCNIINLSQITLLWSTKTFNTQHL